MDKPYVQVVIAITLPVRRKPTRKLAARLERVRRDLLAIGGEGAGLELETTHLSDFAAAMEQVLSICRRARATVKGDDRDE